MIRCTVMSSAPYQLSITPIVIGGILVATAVPIEFAAYAGWSSTPRFWDFTQNLLLYIPLGIALWREPVWRVGLLATALSIAIEVTQLWGVDRFASAYDVVANALGAVVAASFFHHLAERRRIQGDWMNVTFGRLALAVVVALGILAVWSLPSPPSALAGWDPAYPLLIGNEQTNDRPWNGTIMRLTLAPGAPTGPSVEASGPLGPNHGSTFTSSRRTILLGGPAQTLPRSVSDALAHAVNGSGKLHVAVQMRTDDLTQRGPARIVTFSVDPFHRNFDLGQDGDRLVFRVRTPISGANGQRVRVDSLSVLQSGRNLDVVAAYDGTIARIYADGALVGRSNIAAAGCVIESLCGWAVPSAWAFLGGVFALMALAVLPITTKRGAVIGTLLAGTIPIAVVHFLPQYVLLAGSSRWFPALSLFGAGIVGIAAERSGTTRSVQNEAKPATRSTAKSL